MAEKKERLHALIDGRVQGVGFRYFVVEKAHALGLNGWVRNRSDETVEVTVEGERVVLDQFLSVLNRGPRAAVVIQVKANWQEATGEFHRFSILSSY
jgi:acylphosphatase